MPSVAETRSTCGGTPTQLARLNRKKDKEPRSVPRRAKRARGWHPKQLKEKRALRAALLATLESSPNSPMKNRHRRPAKKREPRIALPDHGDEAKPTQKDEPPKKSDRRQYDRRPSRANGGLLAESN